MKEFCYSAPDFEAKKQKIVGHILISGYILWLVIKGIISLLPIVCYILSHTVYTYDEKYGSNYYNYNYAILVLETGLIIWYLFIQCLWLTSFRTIGNRYYYYIFYTSIIPYYKFDKTFEYERIKQEYFRTLKSFAVKKVLEQFFDRDVSNIIVCYYDNMV